MEIQTIWENGVLRPKAPLKLKHSHVTIQVPNEEIVSTDQIESNGAASDGKASEQKAPLDVLLAEYPDDPWLNKIKEIEEKILAIPDDQFPELTEEQLERISAFANREDR